MVVTYGHAKDIKEILTKMTSLVDELVVVRDGPEIEDVLNVAKSFGAKVHATEERRGFADPHRQLAREMCTGEWILWSDTDERWEGDLLNLRNRIIRLDKKGFETIYIPRHNIYRGSHEVHPRIFKNNSTFRFNDIIHYVHEGMSKPIRIDNVWIKHYDIHDAKTPDGKYVYLDYMIEKMKRYKKAQAENRKKYAGNPYILNREGSNYNYDKIIENLERERV